MTLHRGGLPTTWVGALEPLRSEHPGGEAPH